MKWLKDNWFIILIVIALYLFGKDIYNTFIKGNSSTSQGIPPQVQMKLDSIEHVNKSIIEENTELRIQRAIDSVTIANNKQQVIIYKTAYQKQVEINNQNTADNNFNRLKSVLRLRSGQE